MPENIVDVEVVGGPRIPVDWKQGMNAQDALEEAYAKVNSSERFTYALQYYGPSLGYLVLMINETYDSFLSSSAPFFYWEFLLNGQPATSGIDHTPLNAGDHILFSFERYQPDVHSKSMLRAKYEYQTTGLRNK
jgi:hypothetical protein